MPKTTRLPYCPKSNKRNRNRKTDRQTERQARHKDKWIETE